ncbi:MAG: hypothetical protein M0016_00025 [Deltaproteobacteria bacterium]|jgi:hypothetical protein|nr:hypothetical protein [Deltaproteobacteria bacterium]
MNVNLSIFKDFFTKGFIKIRCESWERGEYIYYDTVKDKIFDEFGEEVYTSILDGCAEWYLL